jgi:tripartite-type tricarboxylate transporter receptor subunit TctC
MCERVNTPSQHPLLRCRVAWVLASFVISCESLAADAENVAMYPFRPVRAIVPYAPGGGTDILIRLLGAKLYEKWGQPLIVDNRPGGGTVIGTEAVARSPADGYTLLISTGTHAVNAALYPKLSFDPVKSFEPVTLLAVAPNVLVVHPSVPVKSVKELISLARSRPGQLNYSSSGNGGTGHLAMELLKQTAHIDLVHIPYKGAAPATNAVVSGEVISSIGNVIAVLPQVGTGRLRALAVTTSRRSSVLPDVPTISESALPGFEASAWFGVWSPAGTPAVIVNKLAGDFRSALKLPEVEKNLAAQGAEPASSSPGEFAKIVADDINRWRRVLSSVKIGQE